MSSNNMNDENISTSEHSQVLQQYRNKCRQHRETEDNLKRLRLDTQSLVTQYDKTERDLQALHSVGQIIGGCSSSSSSSPDGNNNVEFWTEVRGRMSYPTEYIEAEARFKGSAGNDYVDYYADIAEGGGSHGVSHVGCVYW